MENQSIVPLKLFNDSALGEGTNLSHDGLGFTIYADILAKAALNTDGPFTIGVFGEWGTGKTSLLRMIQQKLEDIQNVATVWFNAWRYEQDDHPLVPMLATIINELQSERQKDFLAGLKNDGDNILDTLRSIAYSFSTKAKVKIPGTVEAEVGFSSKDAIDRFDRLHADQLIEKSLYYQAFDRLQNIPRKKNELIVVIIDDLDRCFPEKAVKLLESIKLVLSQRGFIFIIGVAQSVIEGYLQHRYGMEYGIRNYNQYLDKIVQLPFQIPPHTERIKSFCNSLLSRIGESFSSQIKEIVPIMGYATKSNPRSIIRFVNTLLIDQAIFSSLYERDTSNDGLNIGHFAVCRCLQQRWPDVYSVMSGSDSLCNEIGNWDVKDYSKHLTSENTQHAFMAKMLKSHPDLAAVLKTSQGKQWLTSKRHREMTIQFFIKQRGENEFGRYNAIICHTTGDSDAARKIERAMIKNRMKVLMVNETTPLSDRLPSVTKNIFLCIGPHCNQSQWCNNLIVPEVNRILDKDDVFVWVVLLPGTSQSDIPSRLQGDVMHLDFQQGLDPETLEGVLGNLQL